MALKSLITVKRPWGSYKILHRGKNYKVKEVKVLPLRRLSLQFHSKRSEHWIVVEGKAKVTNDNGSFILLKGQSAYISCNALHRLENPFKKTVKIVEIQQGDYLGEDDITRIDDDFHRKLLKKRKK